MSRTWLLPGAPMLLGKAPEGSRPAPVEAVCRGSLMPCRLPRSLKASSALCCSCRRMACGKRQSFMDLCWLVLVPWQLIQL